VSDETRSGILLPEPEGFPCVKVCLDQPGMHVLAQGEPGEVMARIAEWLRDYERGANIAGFLEFRDPKFGCEFYLTQAALLKVTSVERSWLVDASQRVVRPHRPPLALS
jgi:hypothetical protein